MTKKYIHIPNQGFNKRINGNGKTNQAYEPLETLKHFNMLNEDMKKQAKRKGTNTKQKCHIIAQKNLHQKNS